RRPDLGNLRPRLRPNVPNPLRRPNPQRSPGGDDGRRQHLRTRPRKLDPRGGKGGSGGACKAPPDRPDVDPAGGRGAGLSRSDGAQAVFERHGPTRPQLGAGSGAQGMTSIPSPSHRFAAGPSLSPAGRGVSAAPPKKP